MRKRIIGLGVLIVVLLFMAFTYQNKQSPAEDCYEEKILVNPLREIVKPTEDAEPLEIKTIEPFKNFEIEGLEVIRQLTIRCDALRIREEPLIDKDNRNVIGLTKHKEKMNIIGFEIDEKGNVWCKVAFYNWRSPNVQTGYSLYRHRYFLETAHLPEEEAEIKVEQLEKDVSEVDSFDYLEKDANKTVGTYGRLVIPNILITCQLNAADTSTVEGRMMAKHYAEEPDCASYAVRETGLKVIHDTNKQDFSKLKEVKEGQVAYIGDGKQVFKIRCTSVAHATYNELEDTFVTEAGENVFLAREGGYMMYTEDNSKEGYNVFVSFWR